MKKFEFDLDNAHLDKFFPKYRIKNKAHIIELLMEATRYMLINPNITADNVVGKILLYVDKMSRLFFFTENKYFSISFPFLVHELDEEQQHKFSFQNDINIDSKLIGQVIQIIKCDEFKEKCSFNFIAPICDYEENCDENFWIFLRELLLMEDGYIRYDFDENNYKKFKEKGEEHLHPLNHYDLFYSNNTTFKIGLNYKINKDEFIDFVNVKINCKYLNK